MALDTGDPTLAEQTADAFAELEKLSADQLQLKAQLAEKDKQVTDKAVEVGKLLEAGGTLGDPLKDNVFLSYGHIGLKEPHWSKIKALQDQLVGKAGEFVLLRYSTEVRERFGGDIRPGDFRKTGCFRIAVLAGDKLKVGQYGGLTLPCKEYLEGDWREGAWGASFEDEPVDNDIFGWVDPGRHPEPLIMHLMNDHLAANLYIGDAAVKELLKMSRNESLFAQAAEKLGRLVLEPTDAT